DAIEPVLVRPRAPAGAFRDVERDTQARALELIAQHWLSPRRQRSRQRLKLDGDGIDVQLLGIKLGVHWAGGVGGSGWEHANLLRAVGLGRPHPKGPPKPAERIAGPTR